MSSEATVPLDADQLRVLGETRRLGKKLRFARGVALTNVVSLAFLASSTLVLGVFSLTLSPVGLALAALAYNEERGRRLLVAVDPRAPRRLALNQLLLFALVVVYCAWNAYSVWTGPDPLDALASQSDSLNDTLQELSSQTGSSFNELGRWARVAALFVYGAVLAVSAVVQGLTAFYYHSLRASVEAYAETPAWARALG
ncbi:MAG TPA: hypothetical protein VJU61_16290 [Polyangiaceae bacterium]|nr:hypothetical protein [Polyangiaceae bacterium]